GSGRSKTRSTVHGACSAAWVQVPGFAPFASETRLDNKAGFRQIQEAYVFEIRATLSRAPEYSRLGSTGSAAAEHQIRAWALSAPSCFLKPAADAQAHGSVFSPRGPATNCQN